MTTYLDQQRVLHNPFDIETHKKTFTNYLEVVIDAEGNVHYAVPSHQEAMIQSLIPSKYKSRMDLYDAVPREYYFDMISWLNQQSGYIAVWDDHYLGTSNKSQRITLRRLKMAGLYKGSIRNKE